MANGLLEGILGPRRTPEEQERIRQILAQTGAWSGPQVAPVQAAYFGSQFAPGAGALDAMGGMPAAPAAGQSLLDYSVRNPSMAENFRQGNYGTAFMQGLGLLGDMTYAAGPIVGGTLGSAMKAPRAIQKAIKGIDIPPAINSQKTQLGASTVPSYQKASNVLGEGKTLDYGAGRGIGAEKIGADTFEPFPREGFNPTYSNSADIPSNSYENITSLNVLNVMPKDARDAAVMDIGRILKPGGSAVITTRGRDVLNAKGALGPEEMSVITTDNTYQKGFKQPELREYIGGLLGPQYTVQNIPGAKIGQAGVLVTKQQMPTEGRVISERFPTAVKATENPLQDFLRADIESMMQDPAQVKKIADTVKQYVNYRGASNNPETVIESMKEHSIDNLNFIYDQMPADIRNRAAMWYNGANRKANEFAQQYQIPNEAAAGVIAAMSPQKDWYQNVSLGERVIDIVKTKSNVPFDDSIYKVGLDKLKNKDQLQALQRLRGKTLAEVTDPIERAIWVRMFDEAYNPREYNIYSPEGDKLGVYMTAKGEPRKVAWGSFNEITKALMVLDDPSIENISRQMGKQHKVRNFYNNIIMPSNPSSITADTHAVAAALMRPLGGSATEVGHNLGSAASSSMTGIQGTYPIFADAYRDVASQRGLLPRQTQSIAWEGVRGLFSPEQKRDKGLLDKVNNIMLEYRKGKMTQREMQNAILNEAGGITKPDWAR